MGYSSRIAAEAATPKYSVGEIVDLNTWVGMRYGFTIVDRKVIYHMRLSEYAWGYAVYKEGESTTFTFDYIPEGYLRKCKPFNEDEVSL